MKIRYLLLPILLSIICFNCITSNDNTKQKNTIISKIKPKTNPSEIDTLWVSQNDTSVFKQEEVIGSRPCSNPERQVIYELINPKDSAYYFIYNDLQQLVIEGEYTSEYTYEGATYKQGNFYNSKNYSYNENGDLVAIHYQEDGRYVKTELFDSKKRLTEIRYIDKKSQDTKKIEIYKKAS